MEKEIVTIIITGFNASKYLADCFASLYQQTYDNFEIIYVDNASTDNAVDLIKNKFPKTKIIKLDKNYGYAKACNVGAGNAKGEYLVFINTDMKFDRDWLKNLLFTLINNEGNGVATVTSKILDIKTKEASLISFTVPFNFQTVILNDQPDKNFPEISFPHGGSMIIKKELFFDIGAFDEIYFMYHEDFDLGWRLNLFGYKNIIDLQSICYHEGQETTRKIFNREEILFLTLKNSIFTVIKNYDDDNLRKYLPWILTSAYLRLEKGIELFDFDFKPKIKGLFFRLDRLIGEIPKPRFVKETYKACLRRNNKKNEECSFDNLIKKLEDNLPDIKNKRREVQKRRKIQDEKLFNKFCVFPKNIDQKNIFLMEKHWKNDYSNLLSKLEL